MPLLGHAVAATTRPTAPRGRRRRREAELRGRARSLGDGASHAGSGSSESTSRLRRAIADEAFELGRVAWEPRTTSALELLVRGDAQESAPPLALRLAAGLLAGPCRQPGVEPFDFTGVGEPRRVFRRGGSEGWGREAWFD